MENPGELSLVLVVTPLRLVNRGSGFDSWMMHFQNLALSTYSTSAIPSLSLLQKKMENSDLRGIAT